MSMSVLSPQALNARRLEQPKRGYAFEGRLCIYSGGFTRRTLRLRLSEVIVLLTNYTEADRKSIGESEAV